jgi:hypothetical protein
MHKDQKSLLRVAERIASHLQRLGAAHFSFELPNESWDQCQCLIRQIDLCVSRGWLHAAGLLKDRLERAIERCSDRLRNIGRQAAGYGRLAPLQSLGEIFQDLTVLADEFEGVTLDGSSQTVSITTQPIVLEEIALGSFEIRLHWDRIGERRPYEVVALSPNPAGESSDTTHPHVKGNQLCEGDGQAAIAQALRTGRLLDFFQLVSRILDTYNSSSAYVSLSEWNGSPCADCGAVLGDEDQYSCDRCGDLQCRDCLSSCVRCDALCCHSCTNYCHSCEESVCSRCERTCSRCERTFCTSCLSEIGLCEECQENHDAESLEDEDFSPTVETQTPAASAAREQDSFATPPADAVQSDRLGQTAVRP